MEILILLAGAVALFFGVRAFLRGQAQKMNNQLEQSVNETVAREAALALNDEQHRQVYRAIAAEDGRQALAIFKDASGFSLKGSIIAVQALHRFPQNSPSEIQFEQGFNLSAETTTAPGDSDGENASGQYDRPSVTDSDSDDAIAFDSDHRSKSPAGEDIDPPHPADRPDPLADVQDPTSANVDHDADQTGQSKKEAAADGDFPVSKKPGEQPGGSDSRNQRDPQAEARADELLKRSGFNPDDELVIPDDWANQDQEQTGFHLEVQRGEEKIVLSHEDLEPWVHDQLYALLRDDHVDQAARLLADHSPLTPDEAHRFLLAFKNQG